MFVRTKGSAESCVYKASYELWSMVELWSYSDYVHSCLFGYSSDDTETRNDTELLCTQLGTQQKFERKQYNREIWTKTVVCVLSINAGPVLTIGYGPVLVVVQLLLTLSFCHYLHGAPTVKAVRDGQWDETRPKQTTTTRRDGCVVTFRYPLSYLNIVGFFLAREINADILCSLGISNVQQSSKSQMRPNTSIVLI